MQRRLVSSKSLQKIPIEVFPSAALLLSVLICMDPAGLCVPFLWAAALHELGHLLAMAFLNVELQGIEIHGNGAIIRTAPMNRYEELICAAAGPVVNLLLAGLLWRWELLFAMVSLMLAVFNLLPIFPLDGGRICAVLFPSAEFWISFLSLMAMGISSIALCVRHRQGLWPVLLFVVVLLKTMGNRLSEQKLIAKKRFSVYNSGR